MGEIAAFTPGRMTETEYRRERARVGGLLRGTEASAHADQELAALFLRSGWTPEELALIEKQKKTYIYDRLRFGCFLEFSATAEKAEFAPISATLTERKFRRYWALTAGSNERQRFLAVQKLLLTSRDAYGQRKGLGATIADACADGDWHRITTIVERVQAVDQEATEAEVTAVLDGMVKARWYGVIAERREGVRPNYRVRKPTVWIPVDPLRAELAPLLAGLKEQGTKDVVTISPSTVAKLTCFVERLIEKYATQHSHHSESAPKE